MYTLRKLAVKNILHQKFNYGVMFILLFVASVGIFASGFLNKSMKAGLATTADRIGADIIIVPKGFVTDVQDSLFKGKACTVNFEYSWKEKINSVEGVEMTSTQLYLASAGALDCCDSTVQMIATDFDADFTVRPWISKSGVDSLEKNEIIIGSNINKKKGETVKYFGRKFTVRAVLDETGMGYDSCVFLSYQTAYEIARDPAYAKMLPFTKDDEVTSMVLVDVKDGYDIETVATTMKASFEKEPISIYAASTLLRDFSGRLQAFGVYGTLAEILMLIMASVALFAIITIATFKRRGEFGSLLSVGVTKENIGVMLVWEYGYVILGAAILGVLCTCLFVVPFHEAIKQFIGIPYHLPSMKDLVLLCIKTMGIDTVICILASTFSFYKMNKMKPAQMVKEGNG